MFSKYVLNSLKYIQFKVKYGMKLINNIMHTNNLR